MWVACLPSPSLPPSVYARVYYYVYVHYAFNKEWVVHMMRSAVCVCVCIIMIVAIDAVVVSMHF